MEVVLGRTGVWGAQLRDSSDPRTADCANELEELGYSTLWFPAGVGTRAFEIAADLLSATRAASVATGIVSIWATSATQSREGFAAMQALAPGRFVLGLGVSHAALVDRTEQGRYQRPLAAMRAYLDELPTVPREQRIVAALGPKMLALAAAESLGTHPYLVTPAMTHTLRQELPVGVIATEQAVVLETDPDTARAHARRYLQMYLALPNYTNNWLRHGYTDADLAGGGSDRLIDDLVVWGSVASVAARVDEHRLAGADHVCIQVIGSSDRHALPELRELAPALAASSVEPATR
jgi:probable F420-dependent oxidoreductase